MSNESSAAAAATQSDELEDAVAIVGMSVRLPASPNIATFWQNLRDGVESIRDLTEEELLAAGETPSAINDPNYVRRGAPLEGVDHFDAGLFAMSPRDAAVFDPQHRVFLECAYEAFEHAGYIGDHIDGQVGVYAACGASEYMFKNVLGNERIASQVGEWLIRHTGNDTNFLATRVAYEFDLQGPALSVQTACSSTLVAIHLACQSILAGECEMALAGGAVVAPEQHRGYLYKEGEILSPDGHCRPFDAKSAGTILASGAGCVLLKPLADALDDGDNVLAVIRGSAINNDGRDKVGYLAPSVSGQSRVVTEALAVAGVDAREVSYVETHGTGTLIGDPIEVAGLTEAYRETTNDTQFCAIGSLKSNIGHTGEAAGIASLIKTVLSLQHREIPASLHYQTANPQADLPNSPFFVNAELRPWETGGRPRIAGVTGLGAGGTNAHVILQEAPDIDPDEVSEPSPRGHHLVTLSARSSDSLDEASSELVAWLRSHPDVDIADVAYTRLVGRKRFRSARAVAASSASEAADLLEAADSKTVVTHTQPDAVPSVVYMMPGGGAQYAGMGRDLYGHEPVYRDAIDACCDFINPQLSVDLRTLLFATADLDAVNVQLQQPALALPALFATGYATAKLLDSWGIEPEAMIGHSAGEYVVACLAGVISMEDGLSLVALRGRLFETLDSGSMISVNLGEDELTQLLPDGLSVAAINAPDLCVASGPTSLVDELQAVFDERDIGYTRIHIDVAAHSMMLEPILEEFRTFCQTINFSPPQIPYVSNLTGTWITAENVADADYWVNHLRHAVRFSEGINTVLEDSNRVMMEIGPGRTLTSLSRYASSKPFAATPTLRHPQEPFSDVAFALTAVGHAWAAGVDFDTDALYRHNDEPELRRRVPMPTYPFERRRYWVDPDEPGAATGATGLSLAKRTDISDWFSVPGWQRSVIGSDDDATHGVTTMIISDGSALAKATRAEMTRRGDKVVWVQFGERFDERSDDSFVVAPNQADNWQDLLESLQRTGLFPERIVHLSAVGERTRFSRLRRADPIEAYKQVVENDHASVLFLSRALASSAQPLRLVLVTSNVESVLGETNIYPERALLRGAWRVIPRELGHVESLTIDIDPPKSSTRSSLAALIAAETSANHGDDVVAYRDGQRWTRTIDDIALPAPTKTSWQKDGTYLITGGLGGIGLSIAKHISQTAPGAKLALVGRTPMPDARQWDDLLADPSTSAQLTHKIESIREIQAAGAVVETFAADVTDEVAIAGVIDQFTERFGAIVGVIHSAGILRDALIALRTPTAQSAVVDIKALGILILDKLLAKQQPEIVVLCSSVSSELGLPGQVDYTAANAFLDAFAASKAGDRSTRYVSVNWNAWQEVGMAVEAASRSDARGDNDLLHWNGSPTELFDTEQNDGNVATSTAYMSRERSWMLSEHIVRDGESLIPGTGFLELMRTAVVRHNSAAPNSVVELNDVFFLAPFVVEADQSRRLTVKLDRSSDALTVLSESESHPHVTASLSPAPDRQPGVRDIAALLSRCSDRIENFDGDTGQDFMDFGPRWMNVRQVAYGDDEAVLTNQIPPEFADELDDLWLHPAMLDMAAGGAQSLISGFDPKSTFYVPMGYGRVTSLGPMTPTIYSHVRLRPSSVADIAVFDITIYDQEGTEIIDIDGFTMRLTSPGAALTASQGAASSGRRTQIESPIDVALREAIRPEEGVEALDRLLSAQIGHQVFASSVDVTAWAKQVDADASSEDDDDASGLQFERPDIGNEFVAPATKLELELAAMWSDLLGIDQVGRDDDFFDLGGQSLIAVRLFTRMRKKYSVDLALSTLFEAPTIAQCAVVVAARMGIDDPSLDGAEATSSINDSETDAEGSDGVRSPVVGEAGNDPAAFRALVTIQKGRDRLPFYCVHGIGGNVLNFRDLSRAMGRTQPFYGLQAHGIDGVTRPLNSIEEMATAYLEEIRQVQPYGPYFFGGYSGGGLVAFEMAQRVREAGEEVALLVLLDTFPPDMSIEQKPFSFAVAASRIRYERFSYLLRIVTRRIEDRKYNIWRAKIAKILAANETVPTELRELHLEDHFSEVMSHYVRKPWSGRVVLLRAEKLAHAFQSAVGYAYGWDEVVSDGFELVTVPGDHDSMVREPNASLLVEKIASILESTAT